MKKSVVAVAIAIAMFTSGLTSAHGLLPGIDPEIDPTPRTIEPQPIAPCGFGSDIVATPVGKAKLDGGGISTDDSYLRSRAATRGVLVWNRWQDEMSGFAFDALIERPTGFTYGDIHKEFVIQYQLPAAPCHRTVEWSLDTEITLPNGTTPDGVTTPSNGSASFCTSVLDDPDGQMNTADIEFMWVRLGAECASLQSAQGLWRRTLSVSGEMIVPAGHRPNLFVVVRAYVGIGFGFDEEFCVGRCEARRPNGYGKEGYFDVLVPGTSLDRPTGIKIETTPIG